MFTADNSKFDESARHALNGALALLLANTGGMDEDKREQLSQSYSDALNNAWFDGATTSELFNAVSARLGLGREV